MSRHSLLVVSYLFFALWSACDPYPIGCFALSPFFCSNTHANSLSHSCMSNVTRSVKFNKANTGRESSASLNAFNAANVFSLSRPNCVD